MLSPGLTSIDAAWTMENDKSMAKASMPENFNP